MSELELWFNMHIGNIAFSFYLIDTQLTNLDIAVQQLVVLALVIFTPCLCSQFQFKYPQVNTTN